LQLSAAGLANHRRRGGAPQSTPALTYPVEQLPSFDAAFYNAARTELSHVAELMVLPPEAKAFEWRLGTSSVLSASRARKSATSTFGTHDLTERFYSSKTRHCTRHI
jgi:hypothetical protein